MNEEDIYEQCYLITDTVPQSLAFLAACLREENKGRSEMFKSEK